jgi:hypothetical protein
MLNCSNIIISPTFQLVKNLMKLLTLNLSGTNINDKLFTNVEQ